MYYIGIDLGTSAVKLLLMDEAGRIEKIVSKEYPLSFPHPGWAEQNPQDWEKAVIAGLKELTADVEKSAVAGIGTGGQMHGLVTLDEKDEVLRPAILWNDGRSVEETKYLNEEFGKNRLSEAAGNIAFAGFTLPKILWMEKHEPDLFKRVRKICLPKDYINYVLTGAFAGDYSDASGMLLLDVKNRCWSKEMLELGRIDEGMLPVLHESYDVIGTLTPEIAAETGLPTSVRVVAGAGDNAAAAVGTGTVGEGTCNISLGTSGTIFIPSESFRVDAGNALHSFAHADGKYHLMGCILSAASCNAWWNETVLKDHDYTAAGRIDEAHLGKNHVYFLPYLMGERAPHNDPFARGAFIGLSMDTSQEDMTEALLEGVAFAMRDSLEAARAMGIEPKQSMLCGGGTKTKIWQTIFADVMNLPLTLPETEQGPGYGGAILAAVGCGEYRDVKAACRELIHEKELVTPDPDRVALYEERYGVYRRLYPALKDIYPAL